MRYAHLHSSGRYDESAAKWGVELHALVVTHAVVLVTLTEAKNRLIAVDWEKWRHFAARDCAIAWDMTVWKLVTRLRFLFAARIPYMTRMFFPFVVLDHRESGKRLLVVVGHLPTHAGDGPAGRGPEWSRNANSVKKYRRTLKQSSRRIERIARRYDVDHVLFPADWNLDLRDEWTKKMLANHFPGLRVSLPDDYHGPGTYGNAVIDGSLIDDDLFVNRLRVLGDLETSDHRPYVETLSDRNSRD